MTEPLIVTPSKQYRAYPEHIAKILAKHMAMVVWKMDKVASAMWRGRPPRVFIIVEGLFRNRTTLKGPDSKFKGLEPFITTGKGRR